MLSPFECATSILDEHLLSINQEKQQMTFANIKPVKIVLPKKRPKIVLVVDASSHGFRKQDKKGVPSQQKINQPKPQK
jgi:hypothetical protein